MEQTRWWATGATVGLAAIGSLAIAPLTPAQIIPDNTLPTPSSVAPGCTLCTVEGGTQQGGNLFHSFTEFSVPTGGEAVFNNSISIENIFSRVTGDSVSDIDGLLRTNGTANLFLLNPNGIIFGPNAQLDIRGSFTASTADSLIFAEGSTFSATEPEAPPLLTVTLNPGLQLGSNQGAAASQTTLINRGILAVGQDLTLTAGQLDIQGQLHAGGNLSLVGTDSVRLRDSGSQPLVIAAHDQLLVQGTQTLDIFALNHPESGLLSGGDMQLQSETPVIGDAQYWSGGNFQVTTLAGDLGNLASPYDPVIRTLGDVAFNAYIGSSLHILAGGSVNIGTLTITQPEVGAPAEGFLQDTVQLSNGAAVAIDGSAQPTLDIRAGVSPEEIGAIGITGVDAGTDIFLEGPTLTAPATRADITVGDVFIPAANGLVLLTNQYQPNPALAGGDITVTGAGAFGDGIDVQGFDTQGGSVILDARNNIFMESGITSSATLANAGNVALLAQGDILFTEGSSILANGFSGGDILLQSGGTISATGSSVISSNSAAKTPSPRRGSITLSADSVRLLGEEVFIVAYTTGVREGSPIVIQARDTVSLDGSSLFTVSDEAATGSSGDITLTTRRLQMVGGGNASSFALNAGAAGDITITATESVTLEGVSQDGSGPSSLFSNAVPGSQGDAGNISITTPQLRVADGASFLTASFGTGDAGDVFIAADEVVFDGVSTQAGQIRRTGVFTTARDGKGGDIQITGQTLAVTNGARLVASTDLLGSGAAGNITLNLTEAIAVDGNNALGRSSISTNALPGSAGDGGNIEITTRDFSLSNGARLSAETSAPGRGGDITVNSQTFSLGEATQFSASSLGEAGGESGNIMIRTNQFDMRGAGFLFTTTEGRSDAGNIELEIRDRATLSGATTGIFAGTEAPEATGDGGNIRITGPRQISLEDGATIEANSQGTGVGGNIQLAADVLSLNNGATITATTARNQGGNIRLTLQDALLLRNGSLISATAGLAQAGGDGGNITIDASEGFVVAIPTEDSDIVADAFEGQGGNIEITAQGVFGLEPRAQPTAFSDIRASSELGVDGTIQINTLNLDPDQGLVALPSGLLDASQMLAQGCEQAGANASSPGEFYTSGRGGIIPLAEEVLGSDDVLEDLRLPEPVPDAAPITEAQGWVVSDTGDIVLTATPNDEAAHRRCWR